MTLHSTYCRLCKSGAVETLLDFGSQTLSNRFLDSPSQAQEKFHFELGQCQRCGLIQITRPVSPGQLKAPFDWIRYNEQEAHLDQVVERACRLPGVTVDSVIGSISFKDDTTVARFKNRGFHHVWRIESENDLGVADAAAGLETIQDRLTSSQANTVAEKRGRADILIVRHILEHAHDPAAFSDALGRLVNPGGYLVFEVPDCAPALERLDYTMYWEEHIVYFTPELFDQGLAAWGFPVIESTCFPYANENSLVAIVRPGPVSPASPSGGPGTDRLKRCGRNYADQFPAYRRRAGAALERRRNEKCKIAIFGAGHLSCAWINFLGVGESLDFVVDDHPKKKGMFMPGSGLPILESAELIHRKVGLCLLSLSPESEAKVVQKNQAYLENGGSFASIFPGRPNTFVA
jgi:hypothetical protein